MNPFLKAAPPAVEKAEQQMDILNRQLRHTIRLCWKSYAGLKLFKHLTDDFIQEQVGFMNLVRDEDLAHGRNADDLASPAVYLRGPMICGNSATILCELLTGDSMTDARQSFLLSEREKFEKALGWMRLTDGHILVRFDTDKRPAGHAFIFLSTQHKAHDDIFGFIYQTNIGLFDLDAWINDPKSVVSTRFEDYLTRLVKGFRKDPAKTYRDLFIAAGTAETAQNAKLQEIKSKEKEFVEQKIAGSITLRWREVDEHVALTNMGNLVAQLPTEQAMAAMPRHRRMAAMSGSPR